MPVFKKKKGDDGYDTDEVAGLAVGWATWLAFGHHGGGGLVLRWWVPANEENVGSTVATCLVGKQQCSAGIGSVGYLLLTEQPCLRPALAAALQVQTFTSVCKLQL